ncbi:heat stress transcription factor a-6a [Nicotiana attenuata]|uniref:Heat stress transcription factor a-6a n=2 Tax=Nicotiana attenuata TaxID=49451 RepID=A0A1J6IKK0_NICAT|nr:heat stress transcription factor a-6a [Nicotiana attenuata]
MKSDKGKGKMTNNIGELLEEWYEDEGLEDVQIDISMLENDDCQGDNTNNEGIHGSATDAHHHGLGVRNSRRNLQKRACPFVLKIYEMLADIQFNPLISWNGNGTSFIIHDCHKFAAEVLPRFFRHNNISSFVCQLNCYGFRKISWDKFEFQHECFQRGKGQWLKNIKRKGSKKSEMNQQPQEQGIDETVAVTMEKEIEEIREEQNAMREEIIMLHQQLDILEKEMEDNTKQARNHVSSKKAKILEYLLGPLFECIGELGSSEVAQELEEEEKQGDDIEDGVENRGEKRKKQVGEELQGKNEGSKKIAAAGVSDFKSDSDLRKMLMDEMDMNNLAQEQPDNFLESAEQAEGPSFWIDYVEKLDHKPILSGVGPSGKPNFQAISCILST